MQSFEKRIKAELQDVVSLLVQKKYHELEKRSSGIRLTSYEMERAIDEYGCTLVYPTESEFHSIDMIEVQNSNPKKWSVRFDLWSEQEGRSDLSLELTMTEVNEEKIAVEIDDIHVL